MARRGGQRGARATASSGSRQTRQRSFRLPERLLDVLDARAKERGESANRLAERLLDEGLHTDVHPLIHFRAGAGGRPRPALVGTRLYVWQVIASVRSSDGSLEEAAEYLGLTREQVQACVSYYADFQDEVEAYVQEEREFARREQDRWRREQEVLG
jgi:uncharacterized protein (DUF433 family)